MRSLPFLLALLVPACAFDVPPDVEWDANPYDAGPDASTCGNANLELNEACDGELLNGADCTTAGDFTSGTVACNTTCSGFDTSSCVADVTVPQLRQPMNDSYIGTIAVTDSLRPTFAWEPSIVAGDATINYELEYSTDSTFASGVTTVLGTATSFRPGTELGVSSTVPVGARYYWRVRACADAVCSNYSNVWWLNLGRSDRDVNGDGFADVVVGAPGHDTGGTDAGAAYLYFGSSATSLDTSSDGTLSGAIGALGYAVASAGDVNADGFGDVIVGVPSVAAAAGRAFVYLGGPGSTIDGTADGTLTGAAANDYFGGSLASAGDVNGDGYADVIVGAGLNDAGGTDAGRAYVFFGGPGTTFDATIDGTLTGAADTDHFGISVASAGDVNGDGYADVVVGANGSDAGGQDTGRAYVFMGAAGGSVDAVADGTLTGANIGDSFSTVASAGDVNGDGFADIVVGAPYNDGGGAEAGRAYVYLGGTGPAFDETVDTSITGSAGELFGFSLSSAGDVNGDGFADLIIGAIYNDVSGTDAGRAYVYFGGAGPTVNTTVDGTIVGGAAGDLLGCAVSSAGDVDGDGFADVVVGAQSASSDRGRAYVFYGAMGTTFDPAADGTLTGAAVDDAFGFSVAAAYCIADDVTIEA